MTALRPLQLAQDRVDHPFWQCERWVVSAIDPDIAGQLAADLPREDFVRIIRTFEADLGRLAQQLEAAVAARDIEAYRRAAHSLAGAAAAVGATRLERVARVAMDHRSAVDPASLAMGVRHEALAALAELSALADNPPGSD
jgi:HPt (histidine-containing phosphotransfer) domain-containing protein